MKYRPFFQKPALYINILFTDQAVITHDEMGDIFIKGKIGLILNGINP